MKLQKKIHILLTTCSLLVLPLIVYAQVEWIEGVIKRITDILALVAVGLIVIIFIWIGIKYLFSKGDPTKIQEANKAVIWALVGIAVMILAWGAQNFVKWILFGNQVNVNPFG